MADDIGNIDGNTPGREISDVSRVAMLTPQAKIMENYPWLPLTYERPVYASKKKDPLIPVLKTEILPLWRAYQLQSDLNTLDIPCLLYGEKNGKEEASIRVLGDTYTGILLSPTSARELAHQEIRAAELADTEKMLIKPAPERKNMFLWAAGYLKLGLEPLEGVDFGTAFFVPKSDWSAKQLILGLRQNEPQSGPALG